MSKRKDYIMGLQFNYESKSSEMKKESYADRVKREKEEYNQFIANGVNAAKESKTATRLLQLIARMPKLSANNILAIYAQYPEATELKSYQEWMNEGYHVRKNQKAISVIRHNGSYINKDGQEKQSYVVDKLFDVSQTNAKNIQKSQTYDHQSVFYGLAYMINPIQIAIDKDLNSETPMRYDQEQNLVICPPGKTLEALTTGTLDMAYQLLYKVENQQDELIRDCSKYVTAIQLGLPTQMPSQLESFIEKVELEELKDFISSVQTETSKFQQGLEISYGEYEKALKNQDKETYEPEK